MNNEQPPGYTLGDESVPVAPISMTEFEQLKQTGMFTEDDEEHPQEVESIRASVGKTEGRKWQLRALFGNIERLIATNLDMRVEL